MPGPARQEPASGALAVIPCLNERGHIGALISSLLDDPDWSDPLIVVADGGSEDGTQEQAAEIALNDPRVRLLHNPARIQSAAVNLAARTFGAGRRWLVRIDAHAEYPRGYVSALVREGERTGAASVVVAMQTRGRGLFQRAAATAQNSRLGTGGSAHRVGAPAGFVDHGHHALFDLGEFEATGGYDETFTHNEDAEFDVRLRRRGGRIWLTREVEVVYHPRPTPGALFRQYLNYGRGRARTFLKHRERPRARQVLPLAVAPSLLALLAAPAAPLAALPASSWALACLAYGLALAIRNRSAADALAGPAAMIMHAGWSVGFWTQLLKAGGLRGQGPNATAQRRTRPVRFAPDPPGVAAPVAERSAE